MARLYVPPRLCRWESLTATSNWLPGLPASIRAPKGQPGVLLAYESMEALLADYPDVDPRHVLVMETQEVTRD